MNPHRPAGVATSSPGRGHAPRASSRAAEDVRERRPRRPDGCPAAAGRTAADRRAGPGCRRSRSRLRSPATSGRLRPRTGRRPPGHPGGRPQPGRAGRQVGPAVVEAARTFRRVLCQLTRGRRRRTLSPARCTGRTSIPPPRLAEDRREHIADDLVARRVLAPVSGARAAAGERPRCRSCPIRVPLDRRAVRSRTTIRRRTAALDRLARRPELPCRHPAGPPRSPGHEIAPRPTGPRRRCRDRRPMPPSCTPPLRGAVVRTQGSGTIARGCGSATVRLRSTVGAAGSIGDDSADLPVEGRVVGPRLLLGRVVDARRARGRSPGPGIGSARSACPSLDLADRADRFQQPDRIVLVDELLRRQVHQSMELPPRRLVLATVPAEELGEQPRRLLAPSGRPGRSARSPVRPGARPGPGRAPALSVSSARQLGVALDRARDGRPVAAANSIAAAPPASRGAAGC